MGCDIHLYIEYRGSGRTGHWDSFGGRINPGRNYQLFALMAGVRNYDEVSFIEPRGFPENAGYESTGDYRLWVGGGESERGCTSLARAEKWVAEGSSKWINDIHGVPTWITHPDWHSHSWLTSAEFEKVLANYKGFGDDARYFATLASMKKFEEIGYDARIVFWFDN